MNLGHGKRSVAFFIRREDVTAEGGIVNWIQVNILIANGQKIEGNLMDKIGFVILDGRLWEMQ